MSDKANTKHHYLPKMYLNGFADDEAIGVWGRKDGSYRISKTDKVASIRGFYTFTYESGEKRGDLEDAFAKMEFQVDKMLRNIDSLFPPQFNTAYKVGLSEYISLQYLRTPEKRKSVELTYDLTMKMHGRYILHSRADVREALMESGSDYSEETVQQVLDYYSTTPHTMQIVPSKEEVMKMQIDAWPILTEALLAREWHIIIFDKPSLITSDNPVQFITKGSTPAGFETAEEIWFPLSSTRLLVMAIPKYMKQRLVKGDNMLAHRANELQIRASYLEAFGPASIIRQYSGLALGHRALTLISAGFDQDFFEHYNTPPKNPRPTNR